MMRLLAPIMLTGLAALSVETQNDPEWARKGAAKRKTKLQAKGEGTLAPP